VLVTYDLKISQPRHQTDAHQQNQHESRDDTAQENTVFRQRILDRKPPIHGVQLIRASTRILRSSRNTAGHSSVPDNTGYQNDGGR